MMDQLFQQSVQYQAAQPITEPVMITVDEYLEGVKERNMHKTLDKITQRRRQERELDMAEKVAEVITIYLQLVSEGLNPQEAIITVAQEYATDVGLLKGFTLADMAKQVQQAQQTQQSANGAGGQQGQNVEAGK